MKTRISSEYLKSCSERWLSQSQPWEMTTTCVKLFSGKGIVSCTLTPQFLSCTMKSYLGMQQLGKWWSQVRPNVQFSLASASFLLAKMNFTLLPKERSVDSFHSWRRLCLFQSLNSSERQSQYLMYGGGNAFRQSSHLKMDWIEK